MRRALQIHWPEYLIEAAGLGLFMISAGVFGTLLEATGSPLRQALPDPFVRRALMGVAMGLTAVVLIYYPWGQQSGAHYNPAVTLSFLRLGKMKPVDAFFYIVAQFVGGTLGVLLVLGLLRDAFAEPPVSFVVTMPGSQGMLVAFAAEVAIAGLLMSVVLAAMNAPSLSRLTGLFAGTLVALYITFEAPLSGMSINPARSFASALPGRIWTAWWIYFTAPPLGMLLAVELRRALTRRPHTACAKLNHNTQRRCIFCGYGMETRPDEDNAVTCNGRNPLAAPASNSRSEA